ncbi:hypothetical protein P879_11851 [Paragonimus westermani]|uniref:Major facilitator superfamily (MFS) profile domain-containing protein n=1 Tax=Paragonimus westermani TaxID=34504 RepID=A0A8T0D711_9TREM|nr:hypothetical protein P879_11851 [Paragonimus westermani]
MISLRLSLALFTISITTSFQFGYHTGVINAPQLVRGQFFIYVCKKLQLISEFIKNVTRGRYGSVDDAYVTTITSLCVSSFLFGGMVGALLSGLLANKFGRKKSILLLSGPCAVGSVMVMVSQAANSFEIIIIGRALIGFACGAYTGIGPTYMTEIAPCSIRGAAAVLNQLVIVTSLVISQIFGLRELMGTERLWPYLLGLNLIPCVFGFMCLLLCPESPRYLYLVKNDRLTAREALQRLRDSSDEIELDLESYEKESELKTEKVWYLILLPSYSGAHNRLLFVIFGKCATYAWVFWLLSLHKWGSNCQASMVIANTAITMSNYIFKPRSSVVDLV